MASTAWGVVTHDELISAGVTRKEIRVRRERGSLIVVFRGVYRVGHAAASVEATYMAAVKACGDDALLSGLAASHLYELIRGAAPPPEVTAPTLKGIEGIKTKRSVIVTRTAKTAWRGIPITTVPRTLVDIAASVDEDALARAAHNASVRFGVTPDRIEQALARTPNAPGSAALRRVVRGDTRVVLSALEREFLRLLDANALPLPITNRRAGAHYVDCRWPEHKLTVELDSYRYHSSRHAWEQDRRREREAYRRGDQFRRYTWGDVFEDPVLMLTELRALLAP